ncbi:MAG: isoprenyl transferase [Firmicutes bacterium]|nr:isoprenyl transferase [Bacillota bacterium]
MLFALRRLLPKKKLPKTFHRHEIPRHVAIIMDGNGRWAAERGLPRTAGHYAGMGALRRTIRAASDLGIDVLTVFAFSTENWKRPQEEVDFLMRLPQEFLETDLPELMEKNVQVRMSGSREGLPVHTLQAVDTAIKKTKNNTGMILNFALNYGSRAEIVTAVRKITTLVAEGKLDPHDIDEKSFSQYLYTAGLPDPDLLIRCSGEIRLSNFLLWQLAYAELWFTDVYWPDFKGEHLLAAIEAFRKRDRRYGGIKL